MRSEGPGPDAAESVTMRWLHSATRTGLSRFNVSVAGDCFSLRALNVQGDDVNAVESLMLHQDIDRGGRDFHGSLISSVRRRDERAAGMFIADLQGSRSLLFADRSRDDRDVRKPVDLDGARQVTPIPRVGPDRKHQTLWAGTGDRDGVSGDVRAKVETTGQAPPRALGQAAHTSSLRTCVPKNAASRGSWTPVRRIDANTSPSSGSPLRRTGVSRKGELERDQSLSRGSRHVVNLDRLVLHGAILESLCRVGLDVATVAVCGFGCPQGAWQASPQDSGLERCHGGAPTPVWPK